MIAAAYDDKMLVEGIFVGWSGSNPTLVAEEVRLTSDLAPVETVESARGDRALPYTTNGPTQELIEGKYRPGAEASWVSNRDSFPEREPAGGS
jgi:hypothetical protein